jgi:methyl-accepting chemotaxis protein-1 (serine sensor receptor)
LLASPETGFEGIAELRQKQIENTDALFEQSRDKLLEAGDFPMRADLESDIEQSLADATLFRSTVDALLQQPLESRDPAAITKVVNDIKDKITYMKGLATHMVTPNSVTSAVTILLGDLQSQAFIIREYGGRARSLYAVATLHGRTLTKTELDYVEAMMHRMEEAWQEITHITKTFDTPETVDAQLKVVEQAMMTDFADLLASLNAQMKVQVEKVAAEGNSEAPASQDDGSVPITYNVSFEQFFEGTTASLKSASELSNITGQTLTGLWEEKAAAELRTMIVAIGALVFVIGLS